MRILALDTTTRQGSVALLVDGRVEYEAESDGSEPPAARLPGFVADPHEVIDLGKQSTTNPLQNQLAPDLIFRRLS